MKNGDDEEVLLLVSNANCALFFVNCDMSEVQILRHSREFIISGVCDFEAGV